MSWLLAALLFASAPAWAQDEEPDEAQGQAAPGQVSDAELTRNMRDQIKGDPRVADSLAERIARSSLGGRISGAPDPETRAKEIRRWMDQNPDSAAGIAVGLARDDADGTHAFEEALNRSAQSHEFTLDKTKGIYGRLKKSGMDSKLMKKQIAEPKKEGEEMTGEEQREILKNMFEGQGGMSNRIITQEEEAGPRKDYPGAGAPGAGLASGYYDRLSQGNLRGYSPQLQALQSALNARRVPGAPKLIETGKLDYETLSYPAYGMRFDVANLALKLRYEEAYALARLLGRERELTPEQLLDPAVLARLKAEAAAKGKLDPRFERRENVLNRAAAALRDFEAAAAESKGPNKISKQLLMTLGAKQKEAARWITAASLEEELQRLDQQKDFLNPELLERIAAVTASEGTRTSYKRRGEDYKGKLAKLRANDEAAVNMLESDGWQSSVDAVERALTENTVLRKDLFRNIDDFVKTPYRFAALLSPKPRWRDWLDSAILRFMPSSAQAKALRRQETQKATLVEVFTKIATGDLEAAHTILSSYDPSGGPRTKR